MQVQWYVMMHKMNELTPKLYVFEQNKVKKAPKISEKFQRYSTHFNAIQRTFINRKWASTHFGVKTLIRCMPGINSLNLITNQSG